MIRFFNNHPTAANLMMLAILAAGIFTLPDLQRETFPDFFPAEVQISVPYPGATASEVEEAICRRLENALESVTFVEETRSEARENIGTVVVQMREGANFQEFFNDIRTEVEAIDDFPEETEEPLVEALYKTDPVVTLAITGPMSDTDLKIFCEELEDEIQLHTEVTQVDLGGFSDRQIRIEIPAQTLMQYGLSLDEVAGIIKRQSVDLPAGAIENSEQEVVIRFTEERKSAHEFRDLIVFAEPGGGIIRLGDIAKISDRFELEEEKVFFNGQRAGLLHIKKTSDQDALDVLASLKTFLKKEERRSPPGVSFQITEDFTSIVKDRLRMLVKNGVQGFILVFLTMWLFFGRRFSFWVAAGLPVSFLGAIFVMQYFGLSLNMLTMVGLLIALGLIMDDAIVIAENIITHFRKGANAFDASAAGVKEVAKGVVSSFVTTICVFGPLAFLEGTIGRVLEAMPAVLILTLIVSLVEAFFILPHHLSHSLESREDKPGRLRQKVEEGMEYVRDILLDRLIKFVLAWRYAAVGLVVFVFLFSLGLVAGGWIPFTAFPELDGDVVAARLQLPQGTPLEKTEEIVKRLTEAIEEVNEELTPAQPSGQSLVKNISVRYNMNADAYASGPHLATITIDLLSAEIRASTSDEILGLWREKTGEPADVLNLKFTEPVLSPAGRSFDIRISGQNLQQMKNAGEELTRELAGYKGAVDITDDLHPGRPEVHVTLREGAFGLGLDAANVASQLRSAFYGKTASEIQVGTEDIEIDVRFSEEDRDSMADIDGFRLTLPNGKQIPLSSAARLQYGRGWARIAHIDGQRTVSVQGDIDKRRGNTAQILADLEENYFPLLKEKYPDLTIRFSGEYEETQTTQGSMKRAMLIGFLGIYLLLSFQFRSYVEPIIVMAAIPLALIGVIWGHILIGYDLTMPSMMGFASLAGIVVNDSILLVVFIKKRIDQGHSAMEAAARASGDRFRAILLTSLTTIAGLLPLLSEGSLQAQILKPLAVSIVFGLMASTVLILIIVPALYGILDDFGFTTHKTKTKQKKEESK